MGFFSLAQWDGGTHSAIEGISDLEVSRLWHRRYMLSEHAHGLYVGLMRPWAAFCRVQIDR
jgi:hypothetical protein